MGPEHVAINVYYEPADHVIALTTDPGCPPRLEWKDGTWWLHYRDRHDDDHERASRLVSWEIGQGDPLDVEWAIEHARAWLEVVSGGTRDRG
jgi:hypothetical protein